MSSQNQRRFFRESGLAHSLLHRGKNGFQEPVRLVLGSPQGLTQADHQPDMGEGFDKFHNGLISIIRVQFRDVALEQFHMVFFRQGKGNVDAVKF